MSEDISAAAVSGKPKAGRCVVSVIIKAFNEEKSICSAIESALRAVAEVGGEVILADSHSTDRTVELASHYPIRVVQLMHADQRCCGVGPQLGYQHSRGEYVYILDGDMRMVRGFLPKALEFLAQHPEVAGVGGRLVELNRTSMEYRERALRSPAHLDPGEVDRLDGGGLYRRQAIEEAGYLSDRNLHAYEEYELAVRLRSLGWKLWRIGADSVTHRGHDAPPYSLLMRRWRARYVWGLGELLRSAYGRRQSKFVWRGLREIKIYAAVLAWWLLLISVPLWQLSAFESVAAFVALAAAPFAIMAWRKQSLERATYSVVSWCFNAAGMVRGLLCDRVPPDTPIASCVLHEPSSSDEPTLPHYA